MACTEIQPAEEEVGQNGFYLDSKEPDRSKFQDFYVNLFQRETALFQSLLSFLRSDLSEALPLFNRQSKINHNERLELFVLLKLIVFRLVQVTGFKLHNP